MPAAPRAVKYGATRDNVLAITAVTGTGELVRFGAATTKAATGYDLFAPADRFPKARWR